MNIQIFTIHDVKAQAYLPPFTLPTKQMALRTFKDTVNDPKHPFSKHPEDYTLYHIGEFDDEIGMVNSIEGKEALANGNDLYIPRDLDEEQMQLFDAQLKDIQHQINELN